MGKTIITHLIALAIGVIAGLFANAAWEWMHRIDTNKIIGTYPYANDYFYANGKTYKNATPSPENNMPRPIDPSDPLPLKFGTQDYKLTIGVSNLNKKQLENVILFLRLPKEVKVTKYNTWGKNSESEYFTSLGGINPGMLARDNQPIYIAVEKPGFYTLTYLISGNFDKIERPLPIIVYEN